MTREAEYVVAQLKRLAQVQAGRMPGSARVAIAPAEQMRRFLAGEERARVARGEITPQQFFEYERAMLKKLRGG